MRLDPKYFNLFIAICALLTLLVIVFGTISYSNKQESEFRKSMADVRIDTLSFSTYAHPSDSLFADDFKGSPTLIQFWSTWSGKSLSVNRYLENNHSDFPELTIIAAAVRDSDELILEHINSRSNKFLYVDGTPFFQSLLVPGIPSQILIDRDGKYFDAQVGDDTTALREKLNRLYHE